MMAGQRKLPVADYYNRQLADIYCFMDSVPDSHKKKDIHQLRVRIKRLRSLFFLIEYIYPFGFRAKDYYSLFKPVFKSAGLLREVQVNSDLLKKFEGTDELQKAYYDYSRMILPGMTEELDRAIAGFSYSRLDIISSRVEELSGMHGEAALAGMITGFINNETGRIRSLAYDPGQAEYIHDIRIILKNIKPLLLLIFPLSYSDFDKPYYSKLNEADSSIGNWHDLHVLTLSLSLFIKTVESRHSVIHQEYGTFEETLAKKRKKALGRAQKSISEILMIFDGDHRQNKGS